MFKKHITLVLFPQKNHPVRKVKLTLPGFILVLCGIGLVLFIWGYMIVDYFRLRSTLSDYEESRYAFMQMDNILSEYKHEQAGMYTNKELLLSINHNLRVIASLEDPPPRPHELTAQEQEAKAEVIKAIKAKGVLASIPDELGSEDLEEQENLAKTKSLLALYQTTGNPQNNIPKGWPVKGYIINRFGLNQDPFTGQMKPEHGVSIATQSFAPVQSTADGIVTFVGKDQFYGNLIVVDHGNGIQTKYGYISDPKVKEGELIKREQVLAQIVNTAMTVGNILHYEVVVYNVPQNPVKFLIGGAVVSSAME